eukprot:496496-Rhodomonas_salina.2
MAGLGTGLGSGMGGVGDDGQTADQQLQIGMQLIQQSYTRRVGLIPSLPFCCRSELSSTPTCIPAAAESLRAALHPCCSLAANVSCLRGAPHPCLSIACHSATSLFSVWSLALPR